MESTTGNNIRVVCRFRPQNKREIGEGGEITTKFDDEMTTCSIDSKDFPGSYTFDKLFDWNTSQAQMFDYTAAATIADVMRGYNGTIFAYGQTGSGKTHTMMGDMDNEEMQGLTPRLVQSIFDTIMKAPDTLEFTVKVSFMEIYMEKIKDLLNPQNDNLPVHEEKSKGVYVKGLLEVFVGSVDDVFEAMKQGQANRVVAFTKMNAESSRSHSIFVLQVNQKNLVNGSNRVGKLSLVDLAGSEKIGKTGATGQTLEEAKKINKSLSALGMVINALTDGKSAHIPYRDSKLTRILQESLGGNSRTTLIINCSPSSFNEAETVGTLRFGMRAKTITNKAKVNAEISPAELKMMLKKAKTDITSLQSYSSSLVNELTVWRSGNPVPEADWVSVNSVASVEKSSSASKPTESPIDGSTADTAKLQGPPLSNDEREEFLKRENELSDLLAEREAELNKLKEMYSIIQEDFASLREKDSGTSAENQTLSSEIQAAKLQLERTALEFKEGQITVESFKEANVELELENEELKKRVSMLESRSDMPTPPVSPPPFQNKEQMKQERLTQMMAEFDPSSIIQDKERQMRDTLSKLSDIGDDSSPPSDPNEIAEQYRELRMSRVQVTQLEETVQELSEKVNDFESKSASLTETNTDLHEKLTALETEYEQLLDRTIEEDEMHATGEAADEIQELKTRLETQYRTKRESQAKQIDELKMELDAREEEIVFLKENLEETNLANTELHNALEMLNNANGMSVDGFKKDEEIDKLRKSMSLQLSDFEVMKKKLMKDLQERCEKIVELELSLDEAREQYTSSNEDPDKMAKLENSIEETRKQYNSVLRNSNSKVQQQKLTFMERNLEQLTNIQKQLVEQNSSLKKELLVNEKKLAARAERIQSLEAVVQDLNKKVEVQNSKFEVELNKLKVKLEQANSGQTSSWLYSGSRIAKPLRGGGAKPVAGEDDDSLETSDMDPLSNIKKNLGASSSSQNKRSSWYINLLKK